jgi:DNA-binding response OmpR family regulator
VQAGHFPGDTDRPNLTAVDDARPTRSNSRYRSGTIEIDATQRSVLIDETPAKIGARAFDLLLALVERRERVVPKRELMDLGVCMACTRG